MAHPLLSRLLDRLEVNAPYMGLLAEGYDTWLPVDGPLEEEPVYRRLLAGIDGPILELGCGTGRPLLRWLADGLAVEGLDNSPDMLAILARHATARGLRPTIHLAEMAPLALDRRYGAIVCPAGSFSLIDDEARAHASLRSYLDHLRPGGLLALTLSAPGRGDEAGSGGGDGLTWHVRRTGTTAAGKTIVVNEAFEVDHDARLSVVLDRIEAYGRDGRLEATELRRYHLRHWPRAEFDELLAACGFVEVRSIGSDRGWVATARRAAAT